MWSVTPVLWGRNKQLQRLASAPAWPKRKTPGSVRDRVLKTRWRVTEGDMWGQPVASPCVPMFKGMRTRVHTQICGIKHRCCIASAPACLQTFPGVVRSLVGKWKQKHEPSLGNKRDMDQVVASLLRKQRVVSSRCMCLRRRSWPLSVSVWRVAVCGCLQRFPSIPVSEETDQFLPSSSSRRLYGTEGEGRLHYHFFQGMVMMAFSTLLTSIEVEHSGTCSPEPDSHISSKMLSTLSNLKCLGFWIFHILEYLHIVKENLGDGTGVYSIYKIIYVSYTPYVHNPREIYSVFSIILCMKRQSRNSEFLRVSNFQIRGARSMYLCGTED